MKTSSLLPNKDKAYDFIVDGIAYKINPDRNSVCVTFEIDSFERDMPSYTKVRDSLIIPELVTNNDIRYIVTSISERAFIFCSGFTGSLVIPKSVTAIGCEAFRGCSGFTGSLIIPNSVNTVGAGAFSGCRGFTGSLAIPDSVTVIGDSAFKDCTCFTGTLTIPNSVKTIGAGAFYGCSGFTGLLTIPDSVTVIEDSAFRGCSGFTGLLTIPDSVTVIGNSAFRNCRGFTGSLNIPDSVTKINNKTFKGCDGFTGSLTISNLVTAIGSEAFSGCCGFTGSLTIGKSVTEIGFNAFAWCGFTGMLIIPYSVAVIGFQAFLQCCFESVVIPNSVNTDFNAFGCNGVHTLTLVGNGIWEHWLFEGLMISQIKTLNVGSGVTELGDLGFKPKVVNNFAETPPTCTEKTFENNEAKLHVPSSSTVAYFTNSTWQNFGNLANDINEKITLDKAEATLTVSEELQLKAVSFPSNMTNEIKWGSSNPRIAKVDENGLVKSVSQGECDIFAYLSYIPAVYASCHIGSYVGIILDINKANITLNQIITLIPKYNSKVTNIKVTSSNTAVVIARIVTLDDMKKVQVVGVAQGTATITVIDDGEIYRPAICVVTVL